MKYGFKNNQRIRIILRDIHIYSTVSTYSNTIATIWAIRAIDHALKLIEADKGATWGVDY